MQPSDVPVQLLFADTEQRFVCQLRVGARLVSRRSHLQAWELLFELHVASCVVKVVMCVEDVVKFPAPVEQHGCNGWTLKTNRCRASSTGTMQRMHAAA